MNDQRVHVVTIGAEPAATETLLRAIEEARLARELLESKLAQLADAAQLFVKSLKSPQ